MSTNYLVEISKLKNIGMKHYGQYVEQVIIFREKITLGMWVAQLPNIK